MLDLNNNQLEMLYLLWGPSWSWLYGS